MTVGIIEKSVKTDAILLNQSPNYYLVAVNSKKTENSCLCVYDARLSNCKKRPDNSISMGEVLTLMTESVDNFLFVA